MDISIIIPTYNGAKRLPKVLDKLKAQKGHEKISHEILLVDNNSTDNTREVFEECRRRWDLTDVPFRYLFEQRQGAAVARQRAVVEAKGDVIAFLDDDCAPAHDWLKELYKFGAEHPKAGAWGSRVLPGHDLVVPERILTIKRHLALEDFGPGTMMYKPDKLVLPPTAALAVRKQAWLDNVPEEQLLSGRSRGFPAQGDDYEPLLYIFKAGWEIWYNGNMTVWHDLDPVRFTPGHLKFICYANGTPTYSLRMIITPEIMKPVVFLRHVIGSFIRLIEHICKWRSKVLFDDIVKAEGLYMLGILISPYFYVKLLFIRWIKSNLSRR